MENKPYLDDSWMAEQILRHGDSTSIGEANGIPARTIRRYLKRFRDRQAQLSILNMETQYPIAPMAEELVLTGNGVVSSDWHLPLTDYKLAARLVQTAIDHGLTDWLLIVGDYFNLDAMSRFDEKQESAGLSVELAAAGQLLELLLEVFGTIYITKGNHDWRFLGKLGFKLKFEKSIKMLLPDIPDEKMERIIVTTYDYVRIETPSGPWHCAHTSQYSKIPMSVPRELCDIYGMHVAGAHRHHHGITTSKGGYMAVELGGLFDPDKAHYLKQYTNTFPKWTPGWMLLYEGMPYLPMLSPVPPFAS